MYLYIGVAIAITLLLIFITTCVAKCCCGNSTLCCCYPCCSDSISSDPKKSGKFSNSKQRLSAKVRRTTSWIKTRSLPKAPCDEEDSCIHSGCTPHTQYPDNRKLLQNGSSPCPGRGQTTPVPSGKAKKSSNDGARNDYVPSPELKRSSRGVSAHTKETHQRRSIVDLPPPHPLGTSISSSAFSFQPAQDGENSYLQPLQPNLSTSANSSSFSIPSRHTDIELLDLGGTPLSKTKSTTVTSSDGFTAVEIIDDDDDWDDPTLDPDHPEFRGKDRSYSKLSYTTTDVSHYQGLDLNTLTLSHQNSSTSLNDGGQGVNIEGFSERLSPSPRKLSPMNNNSCNDDIKIRTSSFPKPLKSFSLDSNDSMTLSDTKSVLYQSLDSPPYQSIEQYQEAYYGAGDSGHRSSSEYLEPSDGVTGSYQDMNGAVTGVADGLYSSPRAIPLPGTAGNPSSYPYTERYLRERQHLSHSTGDLTAGGDQVYVIPNYNEKNNKRGKSVSQIDSILNAAKHYEITDVGGCGSSIADSDADYQNDYVASYLDLTAPDDEIIL